MPARSATNRLGGFPSPNGRKTHFMNEYEMLTRKPPRRRCRYSWKDIALIVGVTLGVGGFAVVMTNLFLDTVGLECVVIHCVKVIR